MKPAALNYQQLFESLPTCYVVLSPRLEILDASAEYLRGLGKSREEIVGENLVDLFTESSSEPGSQEVAELLSSMAEILKTRLPNTTLLRRPGKNGEGSTLKAESVYWRTVNSPVLAPNGEVAYIVRRVENVTNLVDQERVRRVIETERDLFFTHSSDAMGIVGTDGYFKRVNPAFQRALGLAEAELCSRQLLDFLHPDDVTRTKSGIKILADGTPRQESINRFRCKDGSYKWFSWNTSPLGEEFYTVGRDITDQIKNEERIRDLNLELERRNQDLESKIQARVAELREKEGQLRQLQKLDAIGRLAGGIAHDFNNILGAILMYCELIRGRATDAIKVEQVAKQIEKVTEKGAALTRQLLIFSSQKTLEVRALHLNDLLKDHLKMLSRLIGENVKVELRLADDLPPLVANPGQIEQVIMNLLINARDAMEGGGKILIETRLEVLTEQFVGSHLSSKPGPHILLSVTDSGCGMDELTVSRIFEPFFTTKPVGRGTGLGLSTVYGIVKSLEGTIWVYSEPGRGTTFKVFLPVDRADIQLPTETEPQVSALTGAETLLVVEDHGNLRELFADALREIGFKVLTAENGRSALQVLADHPEIEFVIADMIMPEMGGGELVRRILKLYPRARILCVSGYPGDDSDIAALGNGKVGYLEKPFTTAKLMSRLRALKPA